MKRIVQNIIPAFLASLFLLPIAYLILLSLAGSWYFPELLPSFFTGKWWALSFRGSGSVGYGLALSLLIGASVSLAATLSGFLTSRWIALSRHRERWLLMAYFPFVLSPVVLAATLYFFFVKAGWSGSLYGVLAGQFLIAYPYAVLLFSGYWNRQLLTMSDVAATLGANATQRYFRVLFPLSRGILLLALFQTFLISWFEYGLTAYIGVGKVPVLTVQVYRYISEANPYLAAVASVLLILPPLLMLWVNKRFLMRLF